MTGTTRRRLPARVYWVRRLMVLGIAVLLVVGIARLLGGGSDGSSGPDQAQTVADASSPASTPATTPSSTDSTAPGQTGGKHKKKQPTADPTPVSMPSGPCPADDISITPSVPKPIAGRDIKLVLDLSTVATPACDWTMSSRTLALKITSPCATCAAGQDVIWTSVECGGSIPKQDLVLRQGAPVRVPITWNARRSEPGCPRLTPWALPGTYHLHVAALAGHPQDLTFLLDAPTPAEVTQTAQPHKHHAKH